MLRRILDKLPCVAGLRSEIRELENKCSGMAEINREIANENTALRSYVGYLVNEPHTVMMDNHGKYVAINPEKLGKYEHTTINVRQIPPLKTVLLYADRKERGN